VLKEPIICELNLGHVLKARKERHNYEPFENLKKVIINEILINSNVGSDLGHKTPPTSLRPIIAVHERIF
jgi:hypothetical protein